MATAREEIVTDEIETDAEVQETDGAANDTPPTDPKEAAAYWQGKANERDALIKAKEKEVQKLQGNLQEEQIAKVTWYEKSKDLESKLSASSSNGAVDKKSVPVVDDDSELEKQVAQELGDLGELWTSEGGEQKLAAAVVKAAKRIASKNAGTNMDEVKNFFFGELDKIRAAGEIAEEFPELNHADSEFTRAVIARETAMAQDPAYKNLSPQMFRRMAALEVEARMAREGKPRETASRAREERMRRQSGGDGPRPKGGAASKEPSEFQKKVMDRMGVSLDEYVAEAQSIQQYPSH